jgi:phosphatidylinositol glycan class B
MFFNLAIPPLSVLLLLSFFTGSFKRRSHLFFLVTACFLAGHFAIGHKEMRFLFPIAIPFIYLVSSGLEDIYLKYHGRKWATVTVKLLLTLNFGVLAFKMFTPAEEVIKYYNFLYHYSLNKNAVVLSFNKSAFWMDNIEVNFYKPHPAQLAICTDSADVTGVIAKNTGKEIIYLSKHLIADNLLAGHHLELIYCQFPQWVLHFNINNWQERSYIWAVYRIKD